MYAGTKTDRRQVEVQSGVWVHVTVTSRNGSIWFRVAASPATVKFYTGKDEYKKEIIKLKSYLT